MKKTTILFSLLLFMLIGYPASVYAHTGLLTASPDESEQVETPVREIQLTFGTTIESISTMNVTDEAGTEVNVKVAAGKKSMTGTFEQPLENGRYEVEWRIIGEDGHAVKDTYSFTVAVPQAVEEPVTPDQQPEDVAGQTQEDVVAPDQASDSSVTNAEIAEVANDSAADTTSAQEESAPVENSGSNDSSSVSLNSSTTIAIVLLVACVVIVGIGLRTMRSKK